MKKKTIALMFLLFAGILILFQYITDGVWFQFYQIHHETWILMFAFAALIILLDERGILK